jgi:hypothetical protein
VVKIHSSLVNLGRRDVVEGIDGGQDDSPFAVWVFAAQRLGPVVGDLPIPSRRTAADT